MLSRPKSARKLHKNSLFSVNPFWYNVCSIASISDIQHAASRKVQGRLMILLCMSEKNSKTLTRRSSQTMTADFLDKEPPSYWLIIATESGPLFHSCSKDEFFRTPETSRFEGTLDAAVKWYGETFSGQGAAYHDNDDAMRKLVEEGADDASSLESA